ncbi:MAG: hypothetical protein Tsb0020_07980 [Haliangiales bacterium]
MAYYDDPKHQFEAGHVSRDPVQRRRAAGNQMMQTRSAELPPRTQAPWSVVQRDADGSPVPPPRFGTMPADLTAAAFRPDLFALPVQARGGDIDAGPAVDASASPAVSASERGESDAGAAGEVPPSPTLVYYVDGERVVVAVKPDVDTPDALQQAFTQAGAGSCPASVSEITPAEPTWPLFYALYLDQQALAGEVDRAGLGNAAGELAMSSGVPLAHVQVAPGPWQPPGAQPIPMYIGNEAHRLIGLHYESHHQNDDIFRNSTALISILREAASFGVTGLNPEALGAAALLRPDILNLVLRHLYEIKPEQAASAASAEASVYVAALSRAGLAVTLGPSSDPGVNGVIPAPGGYFRFWSPMPGAIIYRYSKQQPVAVPVPEPEPATEPHAQPDKPLGFDHKRLWEWEYWEEVTGLTGAALLMYLIISEGSRLYPPRNLLPIL